MQIEVWQQMQSSITNRTRAFPKGVSQCDAKSACNKQDDLEEQLMAAVAKLKSPRRKRSEAIFDCTGGIKLVNEFGSIYYLCATFSVSALKLVLNKAERKPDFLVA